LLKKLKIGNFKAFGAVQNIPIRPITLIYGANSSGKSSIIHSILLANHALFSSGASPLDVHKPRLSDSVDLGGFRQYIHQHETESELSFGAEISLQDIPQPTRSFFDPCKLITLDYEIGDPVSVWYPPRPSWFNIHESPITLSFHLQLDNSPFLSARLLMTPLPDSSFSLSTPLHIRSNHPFCLTLISRILEAAVLPDTLTPDEFSVTQRYITEGLQSIGMSFESLRPRIGRWMGRLPAPISTRASSLQAAFASRDRELILKAAVDFYLPTFLAELAEHITVVIENTFRDVSYLGPLRTYPPRQLFSHQIDPADGRINVEAWERLATDPSLCSQVNKWLSAADRLQTPYEVVVREWLDSESLRTHLDEYWQKALEKHRYHIEERDTKGPVTLSEISRYDLEDSQDELDMKVHDLESEINELEDEISKYPDLDAEEDWAEEEWAADRDHVDDLESRRSEKADELEMAEYELDSIRGDLEDTKTRPEWELFLDIVKSLPISKLHDLRLIDRKRGIEVSHRDIGIGISQVLPVLVGALTLNGILAIEQPELHLHPALQAELGDLFIQSALKHKMGPGNIEPPGSLILETHSEHLILRIMRRMRDTCNGTLPEGIPPIGPGDVALLFVEHNQNGSGSVVRHLQLAEDGELLDPWPGGFFEEGFKERFS
jgi:AAA domain, putative AbiEii toxin, Type IV TA system